MTETIQAHGHGSEAGGLAWCRGGLVRRREIAGLLSFVRLVA